MIQLTSVTDRTRVTSSYVSQTQSDPCPHSPVRMHWGSSWPDRGSQKVVFISENLCIFRTPSDIMVARLRSIVCSIYKQTDGRTNIILVSAFGCYYSRTSYY